MSKAHKIPKTRSSWICEYCDKEFPSPSVLEIRRRVHTGKRPFSCNLCEYSATTETNLEYHIRQHLQEKPFKCPESGCDFSSCVKGKVTRHHKIVHIREKEFHNQCPISNCSYKTGRKHDLTRHMKTHQEIREKPFKCELCPFKATENGVLKRHMTNIYSEERNFKCQDNGCKYASKSQSDLKKHAGTHGEKNLACRHPNCEYKTNNKPCLNRHVKIHRADSEKRYKCRLCDYSSHLSCNLARHMRIHTKETPYKCKIQGCGFASKTASNLKRHVKSVHEKTRSFKCPFSVFGCSYVAAQKADLERHKTRNTSTSQTHKET